MTQVRFNITFLNLVSYVSMELNNRGIGLIPDLPPICEGRARPTKGFAANMAYKWSASGPKHCLTLLANTSGA